MKGGRRDILSEEKLPEIQEWQGAIYRTGNSLGGFPVESGQSIESYKGGEQAYPAMIEAIDSAQTSVNLLSYTFEMDASGILFIEALDKANRRGVEVRILVDDVGSFFTKFKFYRELKNRNLKGEVFLSVMLKTRFTNLRNHRKLMIVDGLKAFSGSMNIGNEYDLSIESEEMIEDVHFSIEGKIARYLQQIFCEDWEFASGEKLSGEAWFPDDRAFLKGGPLGVRPVLSGPTFDDDRLFWHFLAALQAAEKSIMIATPYFIPNMSLISAICGAQLRGIEIDIVVPQNSDHCYVDWAIMGNLRVLLEKGIRVWASPGIFDHSKLLAVDDSYCQFGSANWDNRSLRLNFELNIEVFGKEFTQTIKDLIEQKRLKSRLITLEEWEQRPIWKKFRDGLARTMAPYL